MNILFLGDISARPGRHTVRDLLPKLKQKHSVDFVIANCENAAGGRGITKGTLNDLSSYGIDFFTSGEHVWKFKEFREELEDDSLPIVRPYNYESTESLPGKGFKEYDLGSRGKLVTISLIGQVFMREYVRSPFWMVDQLLEKNREEWEGAIVLVDFHAEATSEKLTMGNFLANKVTAVVGTHTHVPTADTRMFGDTAYVTDIGMVGPYDASLWVDFEAVTHNFLYPYKKQFEVEFEGRKVFNSVLIEISDDNLSSGPKKSESINRVDKIIS